MSCSCGYVVGVVFRIVVLGDFVTAGAIVIGGVVVVGSNVVAGVGAVVVNFVTVVTAGTVAVVVFAIFVVLEHPPRKISKARTLNTRDLRSSVI